MSAVNTAVITTLLRRRYGHRHPGASQDQRCHHVRVGQAESGDQRDQDQGPGERRRPAATEQPLTEPADQRAANGAITMSEAHPVAAAGPAPSGP